MSRQVDVREITAAQTLPLRSMVLRPNRPVETAIFSGDNDPDTLHLGAFDDDRLVGIASLYRAPLPSTINGPDGFTDETGAVTWQLRGMAVEPAAQGRGYGRVLLNACINHVAEHGGVLLWCNARKEAVEFYVAAGFEVSGNEFVIPDVGPHFVMMRYVNNHFHQRLT
jgi:GNAT superfamily N-acetyltransferase